MIETKTYSGKITGQENEYWWTQQLSHKIVHFRNPFIQNRNHILYLRSILNVNAEFVNIVVFCKAQFHVKTQSAIVIPAEKIRKIIQQYEKGGSARKLDLVCMKARLKRFHHKCGQVSLLF